MIKKIVLISFSLLLYFSNFAITAGSWLNHMKKHLFILILTFLGITTMHPLVAQTYDPYAVQVINNLIANNGLPATPNAPETWDYFATWNDEMPKQLIEFSYSYSNTIHGTAVFEGLTTLKMMMFSYTSLSKIDIKGCTQLQELRCTDSPKLHELDATGCTQLQSVSLIACRFYNIDLSGLDNLIGFTCIKADFVLFGYQFRYAFLQVSLAGAGGAQTNDV